jgi:hypothetical protein
MKHEQIHLITAHTFIMPAYDLFSLEDFIPCGLDDFVLLFGFHWDQDNLMFVHTQDCPEAEWREAIYPTVRDKHFSLIGEKPRKTGKIKYVGAFNFVVPIKYVKSFEEFDHSPCSEKEADQFVVYEWDCKDQFWADYKTVGNEVDEYGGTDLMFFDDKKSASEYALKRHLFLADYYKVTP